MDLTILAPIGAVLALLFAIMQAKKVMKEDEAVAVKPKQTSNKKQSRKQRKNQKK